MESPNDKQKNHWIKNVPSDFRGAQILKSKAPIKGGNNPMQKKFQPLKFLSKEFLSNTPAVNPKPEIEAPNPLNSPAGEATLKAVRIFNMQLAPALRV